MLSDPNRFMIVEMLSCGELCAWVILEKFHIIQPTLSHHMKNLCDCGLVNGRKEGKWTYYSLNDETVQSLNSSWMKQQQQMKIVFAAKYPVRRTAESESDCKVLRRSG